MTGKYRAYPEYKDSEGAWFGNTPSHWINTSLKRVCSLKTGLTPPTDNQENYADEITGLPWVRPEDLNDSGDSVMASKYISLSGWRLMRPVPACSTLICCIGTIGKVGYTACETSTNQQITAACFNESSRYSYYLIQAAREVLEESSTGNVIKILNSERLGSIRFISIPEDEAEKIANFLDHETAKIDTLIEKQQQLIQLLKEKRQAVISHAVTKGLYSLNGGPNAKLRDSGVEWLGEVPEHWVVTPLNLVINTRKGAAFKADDFCDQGVRVVKASDIKQLTIRSSEVFLPEHFFSLYFRAQLKASDIILSSVGSNPDVRNSAVGQVGMVPVELDGSLLNQNTVVFDPNERVVNRAYLFYILQMSGYRDHLDLSAHGTANQSSLNISDMLDFLVGFPPLTEQLEIVSHLNLKVEKLQHLEQCAFESELLLQERRTALISAAVTGKIDVRNWVAPQVSHTNKEVAA